MSSTCQVGYLWDYPRTTEIKLPNHSLIIKVLLSEVRATEFSTKKLAPNRVYLWKEVFYRVQDEQGKYQTKRSGRLKVRKRVLERGDSGKRKRW